MGHSNSVNICNCCCRVANVVTCSASPLHNKAGGHRAAGAPWHCEAGGGGGRGDYDKRFPAGGSWHRKRKKRYQYNSFKEEYCRKKKWEGQRGGGEDSCCCKDEFHPREWRDLRPAEVRIRRGGPAGHHPQGVSVGALLWRRGRGTEEVPLSLSSQTETVRILERRETQAFKFPLPD